MMNNSNHKQVTNRYLMKRFCRGIVSTMPLAFCTLIIALMLSGCVYEHGNSDDYSFSYSDGQEYYFAIVESGKLHKVKQGWLLGQNSLDENKYVGYYESEEGSYLAILDSDTGELQKLTEAEGLITSQKVCISSDKDSVFYLIKGEGIHKYSLASGTDEMFFRMDANGDDNFYVSSDESRVYFIKGDNSDLYCYDFETASEELIVSNIEAFDVASDDSFLIYETRDTENYYIYHDLTSGDERELYSNLYPSRTLDISADDSSFLFVDYNVDGLFADNRKPVICSASIENGKREVLYKFKSYSYRVESVHW